MAGLFNFSQDLNILNHGFFNVMQSLSNTVDELIECVEKAIDDLDRETLSNIANLYS